MREFRKKRLMGSAGDLGFVGSKTTRKIGGLWVWEKHGKQVLCGFISSVRDRPWL